MQSKVCSGCGIEKSFDEFYNRRDRKHGKESRCKTCRSSDVRRYRKNNSETFKKRNKEYYEKNKELYIERRKKLDIQQRLNPEWRFIANLKDLFRKNFKSISEGVFEYTGISESVYLNHIKNSEYWDEYCVSRELNIDHIIPCVVYDRNNPNDIRKCWQPENLRLIPAKENKSKGSKVDIQLIEKHKIKHLLPENYASS